MQTKLTLRLDDALIARAKEWAQTQGISLSEAVAEFFAQVATGEPSKGQLTAWTRRLAGAAASRGTAPTEEKIRRDYRRHLEEKHR